MRAWCVPLATAVLLAVAATARADFSHVVAPGESLSSVASADGLNVTQLAAANGLSPTAELIAGSILMIPPQTTPASIASSAPPATGAPSSYVVQRGDTLSAIALRAGTTVAQLAAANGLNPGGILLAGSLLRLGPSAEQPEETAGNASAGNSAAGTYVVQPGDTLTAIAVRAGMTLAQLAAANGLNPRGILLAGSVLRLGSSAAPTTGNAAASQPVGSAAEGSPSSPPYTTPEYVTPQEVGAIAADYGVPSALAEAIAYQESGFNNGLTSGADARGVMQITPGTWSWIQQALAGSMPLAPASASSNVLGGVLLLRSLLQSTGGNESEAAAGYYQGLPSVLQDGLYPSTQQYVNDVMALTQRFGGG
jgi:LysM repeat protein